MMMGRDVAVSKTQRSVEIALRCGASSAFSLLRASDEGLTRYSNSAIENSTRQYVESLYMRVVVHGRVAAGTTGDLSDAGIDLLAKSIADSAAGGFPSKKPAVIASRADCYPGPCSYDPDTALMSAESRADLIRRACSRVKKRTDVRVFGNAVSGYEERAIANSNGAEAHFCGSLARFQVTALADSNGAGMQRHIGRSLMSVNPEELADRAIEKAADYKEFSEVCPGDYEVVLEPSAAAEVLFHLSYLGLGGLGHLRGSSCLAGQIGNRVMSPLLTVVDDPLHHENMNEAFDWEGVPRRPITLVEKGTFLTPVYDLQTAAEAGTDSTGHGLPPEGAWFSEGPFPTHLMVIPGTSSREQLISNVKNGILVTSFHYTRPLDQRRAIITGMTRNGTFLIEDGEIRGMLPNLRFSVSVSSLLSNVLEVGSDLCLAGDYVMHLSPSIRTHGFTVTGKTSS